MKRDVRELLPLTPVVFEILIALAAGEQHGYAIMQEVGRRTDGRIDLHAGTLDERPDADDERRRYYRLTPFGASVARAETERLEEQVAAARARRLLRKGSA